MRFGSIDNQMYVSNHCSEDIFVLAVPNTYWLWADVAFSIAVAVGITCATGGAAAPAAATVTVNEVSTVMKLVNCAKELMKIVGPYMALARGGYTNISTIQEFIGKSGLRVRPGESIKVNEKSNWSPVQYFGLTGWASIFNGSDFQLMIFTSSCSRKATFYTNSDNSWIVNEHEIVRAKYGTLHEPDRTAGFYRFSVGDRLLAGQKLYPGESLSPSSGDYDFVYQEDGNAVFYERLKPAGERVIWESGTAGSRAGNLSLQAEDGNLVIYQADGKVAWATNIYGPDHRNNEFVIDDCGKLALYRPNDDVVWSKKAPRPLPLHAGSPLYR